MNTPTIVPLDPAALQAAQAHLDNLTKPPGSLGYLEEVTARYVAIRQGQHPVRERRRICLFAGDHGVTDEGVSAFPSEVTTLMVRNILAGGAAINALARNAGADLEVVDVGMAQAPEDLKELRRHNIKRGADNIARGPAMTGEECQAAIAVGMECAQRAAREGVGVLGTGEMGIGNTTPAAAMMAAYLGEPPSDLTGGGTGLSGEALQHKCSVVERALRVNAAALSRPLGVLASVGGLEIAAICGLCLGGAVHGQAVFVDGFISCAGALAALRINPTVKDYLFFAHQSAEPGAQRFFAAEGIRPILSLGMRLGEGTGAALAMPVLAGGVACYDRMATFDSAGITAGS